MTRVPVPDDFERSQVVLMGSAEVDGDYQVGRQPRDGDVVVDARYAPNLAVREDDDGRYVGCPEQFVDDVAAGLGVDPPDVTASDTADEGGADEIDDPAAKIDAGVCPWCEDGDDEYENVGSHAAQAHPEEWAAYTDDE